MKRIFNFGLLLSLISFAASSAEFVLPKYEKLILKNGLTVYLMEQHEVPLVDVKLTIKAGAVADTKAGLALLTADNLLLGTKKIDKDTFEQTLDFVGADIDSSTDSESTVISASFASTNIEEILPLVADSVLSPALNQNEFEKYKTRYLSLLTQVQELPREVIRSYFDALLYRDHPYANQVRGNTDSVTSIELADIKQFHKTWYTPGNSALVIAGDFDSKKIKRLAKKLFGQWRGKSQKFDLPAKLPVPEKSKVLLVNKSDATESRFLIGGPGIARNNPDYTAISVVNTILGARFGSWLNDELRINSGLTYGAGSRFDTKLAGGSFYISTFTKTDTTEEAMDLALKTYARLWEKGIDQATLDSAKAYVKGQLPPDFETSQDLARLLSDMFVFGFDENFINTFSAQVNELDLARTKEIIKRYFPKDKLQFTVVGKAEAIEDTLKKYGVLSKVEITDSTIRL
ncbi:insulinase family protein [Alteromonadaceae bacterium M269]|nr:insulinase family protein [Alteromonadaceae bacterium M269]